MASDTKTQVTFETTDTRNDEMHRTTEQWAEELVAEVEAAKSSEQFRRLLAVGIFVDESRDDPRLVVVSNISREIQDYISIEGENTTLYTNICP
jgi:hypothetical protein